jgi:hypothetical protein
MTNMFVSTIAIERAMPDTSNRIPTCQTPTIFLIMEVFNEKRIP